jgi:hypothetical protein
MALMYVSPDVSLFTAVRKDGDWFVGEVTALQGPKALRVVHECLQLRDRPEQAIQDACNDAERLLVMWSERVPI